MNSSTLPTFAYRYLAPAATMLSYHALTSDTMPNNSATAAYIGATGAIAAICTAGHADELFRRRPVEKASSSETQNKFVLGREGDTLSNQPPTYSVDNKYSRAWFYREYVNPFDASKVVIALNPSDLVFAAGSAVAGVAVFDSLLHFFSSHQNSRVIATLGLFGFICALDTAHLLIRGQIDNK